MDENELLFLADNFIEENINNIIADIKELVDIPSIIEEPQSRAPYGKNIKEALDKSLEICERMGFQTENLDNQIGIASLPGESDDYIATIAHLDVVTAGNGWSSDPFKMIIKDDYLFGRGVIDNKGPYVLTLYMGKFFKELGGNRKYTLKMLAGCDEESGMRDVKHYIVNAPQPLFLFTPDSEFPLCNGEKGILQGNILSNVIDNGNILECYSGNASNVVPDEAYAVLKGEYPNLKPTDRVKISSHKLGIRIDTTGISGHASHAEFSINAIGVLINYLLENNLLTTPEKEFFTLISLLVNNIEGKGIQIDCTDKLFSPLSIIGGKIRFEKGIFKQSFNIRYPPSTSGDELFTKMDNFASNYSARVKDIFDTKPFYTSASKEEIKACLDAYNKIRGLNDLPFTMGGGTYARHFRNAISFGTEIPKEELPDFVGKIHSFDEGISIQRLKMSLKIYILALHRLMLINKFS